MTSVSTRCFFGLFIRVALSLFIYIACLCFNANLVCALSSMESNFIPFFLYIHYF